MRVRLLHSLTILRSDSAGEEQFEVGQTYEVTRLLGASLITEGWAVQEAPAAAAEESEPPTFVSGDVQPPRELATADERPARPPS